MSVFTIQGKTVTPVGTVVVGGAKAGGGMVAITPDGKTALVTRNRDNKISVLSIDGTKVEYTKRDMYRGRASDRARRRVERRDRSGGEPRRWPTGDADTISLIDLTAKPPRVVDTIGVLGQTAEGLKISPDSSRHRRRRPQRQQPREGLAVLQRRGKLVIVRVTGKTMSRSPRRRSATGRRA